MPRDVERLVRTWLAEEDPAPLTVRTSGSTAGPKDVVLSAAAVRTSATATLERIGGPGQWVLALPAHYVAGLQVITRSVLSDTSPVVLADRRDLSDATAALSAERRYLALVPTQLHRWLASDALSLMKYDAVLLGGAPAAQRLLRSAQGMGVRVVTTYGMSETCGGCVYDGVPLDGVGVALGTSGEVRISGPVLFEGYAGEPGRTRSVLHDGWFHTSDLGRLDDDGRLIVLGRADDVVISGGVNVSLASVESRLNDMPGVDEAAVTALPDPEWGVEVVAVVRAGGPAPTLDAVRTFVSGTHPRSWAPRRLVVVDELPALDSGKIDRQALTKLINEHQQ